MSLDCRQGGGGGGSVDKISFEVEVYQDSEGDHIYYSPLSLSERANLFRKITGRQLCGISCEYLSIVSPPVLQQHRMHYTTPNSINKYFGDDSFGGPSVIIIADDDENIGNWHFVFQDIPSDDGTYRAGDAFKIEDSDDKFVTTELPGEGYTKINVLFFDFYE